MSIATAQFSSLEAAESLEHPHHAVDDDRGVIRGGVNEEAEDDVHCVKPFPHTKVAFTHPDLALVFSRNILKTGQIYFSLFL